MNISENCSKIEKALQSSPDPERYLTLFSKMSYKDLKPGEVVVELFGLRFFFHDEKHALACHLYAMEKM